ncbi:MAG: putative P-loop ATPase fused to an acetyltransferase [uncultured archaeon A07HR60]|nr:MAG: putative P-loop ATPase fused to an acetyltransferase [uncultured archaeon A07HR60]
MLTSLARTLHAEACESNQRRLVVLSGSREAGLDAVYTALEAVEIPAEEITVISGRDGFRFERVSPQNSDDLLGQTRQAVVIDAHDRLEPNTLGRVVGAVDGGGLAFLLAPHLDEWATQRDQFDETLAVPPATVGEVTGRFRTRLVDSIRTHPGIAIVDVDTGQVEQTGTTDPQTPDDRAPTSDGSTSGVFGAEVYRRCLTQDQTRAVGALEQLTDAGTAVTLESDRGRGKSSAGGLAAGALAAGGADVVVTAPSLSSTRELFDRAEETLSGLNCSPTVHENPGVTRPSASQGEAIDDESGGRPDTLYRVDATGDGSISFQPPVVAAGAAGEPDAVIVDEAAALPVHLLESFLDATAVAFLTTVHGYEGTGRGFDIRFRERLRQSQYRVTDVELTDPIRYAADDPVERWSFRTLAMDATPAVELAVEDATPETVTYQHLEPSALAADEHRLRETMGLLALAHYQTEPNDLARILDAPNLEVSALLEQGHVVAVALLAREGGLPKSARDAIYEGSRIRGNMIPDLLTSQLRDPDGAAPSGTRVVRIAVHGAVRGRGLGSTLLDRIHADASDSDWVGTGFGATPRLVRFWQQNGYQTVHLSTTRNDASGEHSAIMLFPLSDAGVALTNRHARAFSDRIRDTLSDALRNVEPDVVREVIAAAADHRGVTLSDREWRSVVAAADGPGTYEADPGPFRELAVAAMAGNVDLDVDGERLLVQKVLQGHRWETVADTLGYSSTGAAKRALGSAYTDIVDRFGAGHPVVERDRARFRDR